MREIRGQGWRRLCVAIATGVVLAGPASSGAQSKRPDSTRSRDWRVDTGTAVSGRDLRRSHSSSLPAALLGTIAGLEFRGPEGALGDLAVPELRGLWTLSGTTQALVLVDGVPFEHPYFLSDGFPHGLPYLTDFPLGAIAAVRPLSGAADVALLGSHAFSGALSIETRPDSIQPFSLTAQQRVTVSARAASLAARRFSRADAIAATSGLGLDAAQRAASWDSCHGFCDLQSELYGGQRIGWESSIDVRGGARHLAWSANLVGRGAGQALKDVPNDSYYAGRLSATWIGSRLRVHGAHLMARTAGQRPLDQLSFVVPTIPSFINTHGVPGSFFPGDIQPFNPVAAGTQVDAPFLHTQYFTTANLEADLIEKSQQHLGLRVTAGLHREFELDRSSLGFTTGTLPTLATLADRAMREASVTAALRHDVTRHGVTVISTVGAASRDQRQSLGSFPSLFDSGRGSGFKGYGERSLFASQQWTLGEGRVAASADVRRDAPRLESQSGRALMSWGARLRARVLGRSASKQLAVRAALGRVQHNVFGDPHVQHEIVMPDLAFPSETREELDLGVDGVAAGGRLTGSVTWYGGHTDATLAAPGPGLDGTSASTLTGRLSVRGFEATVRGTLWQSNRGAWSASLIGWRSRTTLDESELSPVRVSATIAKAALQVVRGGTLTRIVSTANQAFTAVGDAAPQLSFAHGQRLRLGRWDADFLIDGAWGGDLINVVKYGRDVFGASADQPDGGAARLAATRAGTSNAYVESAGYWRVRRAHLAYELPGRLRWLSKDWRLELTGQNLVTSSKLLALNPALREYGMPADVRRVSVVSGLPPMRTLSIGLVLGEH